MWFRAYQRMRQISCTRGSHYKTRCKIAITLMGLEKRLKSGLISVCESLLDGVTSPASSETIYTWLLRSNYFFKLDVSPKHKSNLKKKNDTHTNERTNTHKDFFHSTHLKNSKWQQCMMSRCTICLTAELLVSESHNGFIQKAFYNFVFSVFILKYFKSVVETM